MTTALAEPLLQVIVCGNADRGDDGVAAATVAALTPTLSDDLLARLNVVRCLELRVEDLVDLPPGGSCLILDAVVGVEPGSIVELSLDELTEHPGFTPRSSHQLPIDLVVRLAAILRGDPIAGRFIGLAGSEFGYGAALSVAARAAMPVFGTAIGSALDRLARPVVTSPVLGPEA
jgi:hydrogenase maturation protease